MISQENIDRVLNNNGKTYDSDGNKIGSSGQVYLDDQTNSPRWMTVSTGLFGMSESFVPLDGAVMDGDNVRINYTKDQVKDAPRVNPGGVLTVEEENRLYQHYGLGGHGGLRTPDSATETSSLVNPDTDDDSTYSGVTGTGRPAGVFTDQTDPDRVHPNHPADSEPDRDNSARQHRLRRYEFPE
ncbi:hypothetical protein IWX65_003261 [Arthrobacter sp. CAN_A214]|uniref:PRC-barrel domain-containing protein n=1 Tax=Arthrobacter sp. CAN_A214 TaxID=2787720 RepID=UPI0018CB3ACA